MNILVLNCGSSSLKAAIVDSTSGQQARALTVERVGSDTPRMISGDDTRALDAGSDHEAALAIALPALLEGFEGTLAGVGHRVVHGGGAFQAPVRIDDEVIAQIEALNPLAPLHNPANIAGIRAAMALRPSLTHVAVFDTAFHTTMPRRAYTYALPHALAAKHGVRRYGFHGPSHQYVAQRAAQHLGEDLRDLRLITCHLGSGCSVAAIEHGRSVETSMGMTPLEGLVMGTRSGDVDPGVLLHLMRAEDMDVDALDTLLNKQSGLTGLSGAGNDMRDIEARAAEGDTHAREAILTFAHRVRKYIGAYATVMGGVDAIVFTAGIGENSALIRHRICQRLDFLGARLDEDRNRELRLSDETPAAIFSQPHARCRLVAARTDEAHAIAQDTARLVASLDSVQNPLTIPIAISARHAHLTQETVEALFGEGHQLTPRNPLSQPNQFACEETITLVGPRRTIERVRILGPTRPLNQIEISRTDEFTLGIDAPVRASGDVANSPGITVIGTDDRRVDLKQGVICALRHIHMTTDDAARFGVKDRDIVEVAVDTVGRKLIFGDVLIRVKDSYKLEMHIDTDEANAAELSRGAEGALTTTLGRASLRRRRTDNDQVPR